MTKRIFRSMCLVALAAFLASAAMVMGILYEYFTQDQKDQLEHETVLTAHAVANEGMGYFEGLEKTEFRITWINADGTVHYDSQVDTTQENHLQREEIQQALATGAGESVRYSSTMLRVTLYCARKLPDGSVLRLSIAQKTMVSLLIAMSPSMLAMFLVAVGLSLALAFRISRHIVRPLNELDLENPGKSPDYEEIQPLLRRLDTQQRQLRTQEAELQRRQVEFDTVTDSMREGLVLLSGNALVLSINPAAARILGICGSGSGKDFLRLIDIADIQQLVRSALFGQNGETVVQLSSGVYQVDASTVRSDSRISGVVLLILEVTEKYQAEQLRREFSANVSHELKTPLHAISGYAELMKNGLVLPQDVAGFSGKIYAEAQRLIRLVEDIIRLSRLDEGGQSMTWEDTDLYALASDVVSSMEPAAQAAGVCLSVSGSPSRLRGIPQMLSGIVSNLCSNAIKYNHPGGSVLVQVVPGDHLITLSVEDTGIGIPPEHQSRIFERFYRVDKSHSKEVGGTGLGLSIVKHAAGIHGAKIDLQSEPGAGTLIRVYFPIN